MNIKHVWLWLVASFVYCQSTMAQRVIEENDTTYTLYFHVGKYDFDPLFRGNAEVMHRIVTQIDSLCNQPNKKIRSIKVSTSTSPEGGKRLNVNLASDRSKSIVQYLVRMYPRLTQQIVISSELAPDWDMLRDMVNEGNMPMRKEALQILDFYYKYYNPDYSVVDPRETKLKQLNNGHVWKYMLDKYYPDMRYAKVELLHDLIDVRNPFLSEIVPAKEVAVDTVVEPVVVVEKEPIVEVTTPELEWVSKPNFLFALKSNLFFDAIGAFNGEIEVPVAQHISVLAEAIWPWYLHNHDSWSYQAGILDAEVRCWLGKHHIGNPVDKNVRNPLTGYFFGLTGGWGYYDISAHSKGHQGELFIAGITCGYSKRFWRNFNLELSFGVGYVHSNYRRYRVNDIGGENILVRKYNDKFDWIGPVKAKVSLSWLIYNKKKTLVWTD